jgi:type IV pilus assembly protein PilF
VAPRDFKIQENYAVFLCRQDRFDDARKYFDKAIKAPTNDYSEQTYTNAGVCMMQKPDNVAAEEYLRAALERRPNYGEALLQMSVLFYETGDNLRARAFLAISRHPHRGKAWRRQRAARIHAAVAAGLP